MSQKNQKDTNQKGEQEFMEEVQVDVSVEGESLDTIDMVAEQEREEGLKIAETSEDSSLEELEEEDSSFGPQPAEPTAETTDSKEEEQPPEKSIEERLQESEDKYQETYDRYLRLNAEFENFKKRMAKENVDRLKYYHLGLIKELF